MTNLDNDRLLALKRVAGRWKGKAEETRALPPEQKTLKVGAGAAAAAEAAALTAKQRCEQIAAVTAHNSRVSRVLWWWHHSHASKALS